MKVTSTEGAQSGLQTDYIIRILGLDTCADTIVGNQMLRGISGGQRKRVTTGEMIVGPMKTLFMDEITTGLDSQTTHHIVKTLQQIVHLGEATIIMSLLQAAQETFNLFDDIILLAGDKDQEQYWADESKPYQFISAAEFSKRFKQFHVGQDLECRNLKKLVKAIDNIREPMKTFVDLGKANKPFFN
ncbi:hypothetical protein HPP92_024458 [Vanilla planifolia]|uniref:Uncharacterized protein n=1 Tax=Vanilla planifolia TaxID=51239 RepID=A0A835PJP1_VANPL|nr:hypothetical protein HPP92_024458 [Vanilla planifolia]